MFVSLNGERVPLALGRWNASKAVESLMCPESQALVELVKAHGIDGAAERLGVEPDQVRDKIDLARERVGEQKLLCQVDMSILDLIDELGYSDEATARTLKLPLREVRRRYWRARRRLRTKRHDEFIRERISHLSQRDFAAFEMHHVLGHSTGKVAKLLGLNRGHMVRRINRVRELLAAHCQADTPDAKT